MAICSKFRVIAILFLLGSFFSSKAFGMGIRKAASDFPDRDSLKVHKTDTSSYKKKMHTWSIYEKGFSLGYGYGVNGENLPEGIYSPLFFIRKIAIDFPVLNNRLEKHSKITLVFEPQINLVILRDRGPNRLEFELGLGIGIQYRYQIIKSLSAFTNLIVGPQYFTTHTLRQTTGLIFSDNLGAGITYLHQNHWALSGEFRIRHMSNANIVLPNYGINTNNILFSISRFLR